MKIIMVTFHLYRRTCNMGFATTTTYGSQSTGMCFYKRTDASLMSLYKKKKTQCGSVPGWFRLSSVLVAPSSREARTPREHVFRVVYPYDVLCFPMVPMVALPF